MHEKTFSRKVEYMKAIKASLQFPQSTTWFGIVLTYGHSGRSGVRFGDGIMADCQTGSLGLSIKTPMTVCPTGRRSMTLDIRRWNISCRSIVVTKPAGPSGCTKVRLPPCAALPGDQVAFCMWLTRIPDIGFQGMVYVDKQTPYMRLLEPFLKKKKVSAVVLHTSFIQMLMIWYPYSCWPQTAGE